ncbi:hypothetical protein [Leptospira interrogans]|uniref:hypothetical protein n=1 Tax=Leptospira interrogans TaxID=173 RepID=UPI0002BFA7B1|nr:hypothetical protein [Leptospira interrogans]EMN54688.1 hypothetical protein LEP1GSC089_2063 [Leptospira interrogans serovar Autumnalis str. LP101]MCR8647667.1 hypothetical protein [Leptospira interrogans serovar Bataviae]OAM85434.1 hypothetical protein A1343_18170 [Leptospira interrogans serovar Bataviae]QOI33589.1 hypothetical protein LeptoLang_04700 [Leptospira interrogans serovar Icterohaemorrhagiae]QOI36887.1 hypothetical protein Lepto1548_00290 [Leptospira interrogans serovar Bataviae
MSVQTKTIQRYEEVNQLLYDIRKTLFFDKLKAHERKTLEDRKKALEPERATLKNSIDFIQAYDLLDSDSETAIIKLAELGWSVEEWEFKDNTWRKNL